MYLTQLNTLATLLLVPAISQSFQLQIFICIQKTVGTVHCNC
jgi:hypothetical protein